MVIKRLWGIFLGIILIAFVLFATPNSVKDSVNAPPSGKITTSFQNPGSTPTTLSTEWYRYEDKDAGYSISYPSESILTTAVNFNKKYKTVNIQFIHIGSSGGYQGMVIDILENQSEIPIENIIENLYGDSPLKPSLEAIKNSIYVVNIGNTKGIKTIIPATITEFTILIPRKTDVIFIAPVHGPAVESVNSEVLEIFQKILDTLYVVP